jgi:hypothetical protein
VDAPGSHHEVKPVLLNFPFLHARGHVRLQDELEPKRGSRHWLEMDGVVGVPGDAVFPRGVDRLPVVAILIEQPPASRDAVPPPVSSNQ